jgi:hypothetical protein
MGALTAAQDGEKCDKEIA